MEKLIDLLAYPVEKTINILLKDKTTGKNILWATNAYRVNDSRRDIDEIKKENLMDFYAIKLQSRTDKSEEEQQSRTRRKAEVFTPVWMCNKMNNYLDSEWFGRDSVFNTAYEYNWNYNEERITFFEKDTWKKYVDSRRLEITCGEAPFLVSRYDVSTGEFIYPLKKRIGILDRKLRVVNENTTDKEEWMKWVERAFQSCYGFEYQGDNLIIARINFIMTFYEYYKERWKEEPDVRTLRRFANIISWNLWQMDGFTDSIPQGTSEENQEQINVFDAINIKDDIKEDKALLCKIQNWRAEKSVLYHDLKKRGLDMSKSKKLFDFVIGNPPYQEEALVKSSVNGQTRRRSIFQYFQNTADEISSKGSILIYPAGRWIQRSGKGMASFGLKQINDRHLKKVYVFADASEVFQGVAIADGISIVVKDMEKTSDNFIYTFKKNNEEKTVEIEYPGDNILPINPKDILIVKKIEQYIENAKIKSLHERIHPQKLFAIESDFVEKNRESVRLYNGNEKIDFSNEIKLYANDKAGKAGRTTWFIAKRDIITTNAEYIDKYKVVVSSANAGGQKRDSQLEIIDNHSAFGRSRVALASFDTEEEALNFFKYVSSYVIKFAFLMTDEALTTLALKVPDIMDYTGANNIIDFDRDIDIQLKKLLNLTEDEYEYIIETVNERRK